MLVFIEICVAATLNHIVLFSHMTWNILSNAMPCFVIVSISNDIRHCRCLCTHSVIYQCIYSCIYIYTASTEVCPVGIDVQLLSTSVYTAMYGNTQIVVRTIALHMAQCIPMVYI